MSVLVVISVLSIFGTGILIVLSMGSIYMIHQNWHKNATNDRLTSLETGQKQINKRMAKLEEGQARFEIELKDIKEGQAKLETGLDQLNDYVQSELAEFLKKINSIMEDFAKRLPDKK